MYNANARLRIYDLAAQVNELAGDDTYGLALKEIAGELKEISMPPTLADANALPTAHFRAIRTRYVGPTNHRGSRIIADAGDRASRVVWSIDNAHNMDDNHALAALAVVEKMGWNTEYHTPITGGGYNGDCYWVFQSKANA